MEQYVFVSSLLYDTYVSHGLLVMPFVFGFALLLFGSCTCFVVPSCLAASLGLLCPSCLVEIHVSPISLEMGPTKRGMIQIYLEEIT